MYLQIAKDVRAVESGTEPFVKRFIIANNQDSRQTGLHWVPVVYEILRDDEFHLPLQQEIPLSTPAPAPASSKTSSPESSSRSTVDLGAMFDSEQVRSQSPPQNAQMLALIRKWPLGVLKGAAALTLAAFAYDLPRAFTRVLRGHHKHNGLQEDAHYLRVVEQRALLNQREFSFGYYERALLDQREFNFDYYV